MISIDQFVVGPTYLFSTDRGHNYKACSAVRCASMLIVIDSQQFTMMLLSIVGLLCSRIGKNFKLPGVVGYLY